MAGFEAAAEEAMLKNTQTSFRKPDNWIVEEAEKADDMEGQNNFHQKAVGASLVPEVSL